MKTSKSFALSFLLYILLSAASNVYAEEFRFISMADSRGATGGVNDTVLTDIVGNAMLDNADFVLFSGDLVYGSSVESILISELNYWRDVMTPLYLSDMHGAKVYAGPGNHELQYYGAEAVWQSIFSELPSNGPSGETYMTYSFDYLNAHFVMLNTNRVGNPHTINYDWLENDLASTTAEHIFVFGHEPAFPVGPHLGSSLDYYPGQRDEFWQLLADYDVHAYFTGHEHLYDHLEVDGVHQIINGTAGAPIYSGYGGAFYHYALITVNGPEVLVDIIDDTGTVRDSFALDNAEGIPVGATWQYLDDGSNQGTAWRLPGFDDSLWASGTAELGYGDGDEATIVNCGPSAPLCNSNNFITTYFRHSFEVADTSAHNRMKLRVIRDDGAVVYLNGTEVFRSNMPGETIAFDTLAVSGVGGAGEESFYEIAMDPDLLVNGTNILAVEIHQFAPNSSDISFDLKLHLTSDPLPDFKANNSAGPVILNQGDNLNLSIGLDPGNNGGDDADWWIIMLYYNPGSDSWIPVPLANFQSPLFDLPQTTLIDTTQFPAGLFIFYYAVDLRMNGSLDEPRFSDTAVVLIQ